MYEFDWWNAYNSLTIFYPFVDFQCEEAKGFEYSSCTPGCPSTCLYSHKGECTEPCVEGCMCQTGFLKDSSGMCVAEITCSNNNKPLMPLTPLAGASITMPTCPPGKEVRGHSWVHFAHRL